MGQIKRWARIFSIDVRSLAALRIGLGIVLISDLYLRCNFFAKFYTDAGLVPRSSFNYQSGQLPSLYFLFGSAIAVRVLFLIHAFFAIQLILGYRTWLATLGCLVMSWSLTNRNTLITGSGDALLGWLLIWSLFLPLGAVWSWDERMRRRRGCPPTNQTDVLSFGSAAILLQVVLVYLCSVIARLHSREWTVDFSAVHYILTSNYATPLGHRIARYPMVTFFMTMGTMIFESTGPVIALLVARFSKVRAGMVLAFILFHITIGATIYTSTFPAVCVAMWLVFIPGDVWAAIANARVMRWLRSMMHRFTNAPAKLTPAMPMAAARFKWEQHPCMQIAAGCLALYILIINAVVSMPSSWRGPMARLPRIKQSWQMMDEPPRVDLSMRLDAVLANGEGVTLQRGTTTSEDPTGLCDLLWPPEDGRDHCYRSLVARQTATGNVELARHFCTWHSDQWNAAHPHEQRVREMRLTCAVRPVASFDGDESFDPSNVADLLVYQWTEQNTGESAPANKGALAASGEGTLSLPTK